MASSVLLAKGTKLYRKNPVSSVYEEVVQCLTLAIPSINQEWIEITNHSSTGGYREWQTGLKDVRETTVSIYWNPVAIAMHATIMTDALATEPPLRSWGIILPNGLTGWGFTAFMAAPAGTLEINRVVQVDFTLRISGQPTPVSNGTAGLT